VAWHDDWTNVFLAAYNNRNTPNCNAQLGHGQQKKHGSFIQNLMHAEYRERRGMTWGGKSDSQAELARFRSTDRDAQPFKPVIISSSADTRGRESTSRLTS